MCTHAAPRPRLTARIASASAASRVRPPSPPTRGAGVHAAASAFADGVVATKPTLAIAATGVAPGGPGVAAAPASRACAPNSPMPTGRAFGNANHHAHLQVRNLARHRRLVPSQPRNERPHAPLVLLRRLLLRPHPHAHGLRARGERQRGHLRRTRREPPRVRARERPRCTVSGVASRSGATVAMIVVNDRPDSAACGSAGMGRAKSTPSKIRTN